MQRKTEVELRKSAKSPLPKQVLSPLKQRLAVFLFCLFWISGATGCLVGPNFSSPDIPDLQGQFANDTSHIQSQYDSRIDQWWLFFSDPILDQLLQQGVSENLGLRESYFRIAEARARLGLTAGARSPDINTASNFSFSKRSGNLQPFVDDNADPFDLVRSGFDSSWEIDLFGRMARLVEEAGAELDVQEWEFQHLRQTLQSEIAACYLQIRCIQEHLALTKLSMEIQKDTETLVHQRVEDGLAPELDLAQLIALRERTQSTLPKYERELGVELHRLSVLLGQSPNQQLLMDLGQQGLPEVPAFQGIGFPVDLLRRRPDVQREERRIAATSASIGVAEADLYPQLNLLGTIALGSQGLSNFWEFNSLDFQVGPSLRWNVLHFGRINQNIEIQEQRFQQATAKYQQTVLQAVREVEDALVQQDGFRKQSMALGNAIGFDEKAVELSVQRYKAGKASFQRVIDAQEQLLKDLRVHLDARTNAVIESVRLFKAVGGGGCYPDSTTGYLMGETVISHSDGRYPLSIQAPSQPVVEEFAELPPEPSRKTGMTYPLDLFERDSEATQADKQPIPVFGWR